jgi:uncharacterized membrane protein
MSRDHDKFIAGLINGIGISVIFWILIIRGFQWVLETWAQHP